MSAPKSTAPAVILRPGTAGVPYYEAKWRHPQPDGHAKQVKRRLGKAWMEQAADGTWTKRRGRTPDGWLDPRTVHIAAAAQVDAYSQELADAQRQRDAAAVVTVRRLAREFIDWQRHVKQAKPAYLRDLETMLREPGVKHARGTGVSPGYVMRTFGDRPAVDVTAREVSRWLRALDLEERPNGEKLTPRTVNKYRTLLQSVFAYGMRADTYELPSNPVAGTDKRREPELAPLDFYEVEEVEILARACAAGKQRPQPTKLQEYGTDELAMRKLEDDQDAEFFRVLFFSGIRLGEALALRWSDVTFETDLSGAVMHVHRSVSAGVEGTTKGGRGRYIPAPRPAAEAFARLGNRDHFTAPDDYVFCSRLGGRLDDSALRKRYKRAAAAAGLRPIKLHGLRHAAGSIMARSLPLLSVRDVLGHRQLSTTNRYLHGKVEAGAIAAMNAAFNVPSDQADLPASTSS